MTNDDKSQAAELLKQFRMKQLPEDLMARIKGTVMIDLDKRQVKNTIRHSWTNYDQVLSENKVTPVAAALFRRMANEMIDYEMLKHPAKSIRKMAQRYRPED